MLSVDDDTLSALRTHQVGGSRAAAFYLGALTTEVDLSSGSFTLNGNAEVQATGSVVVAGGGSSLVPRAKTDPLATYGQELAVWRTVNVGRDVREIQLGRFRITGAPESQEFRRGDVVTGWSVSLDLDDRFEQIKADDFLNAEGPVAGNTVYDELRRLSPIPVQESLPDQPVPPSTVYDNRLGAITTLCGLLGGDPHLTREGVLTARVKDAWLTATVPVFDIAGVITWREGMSNDYYNQVQVRSSSNNDLVAFAMIKDESDPLAVSRAGGRTFRHESPIYATQSAVNTAAKTILARVSTQRSRVVDVVCGPEALLLDLGDFGWMRDPRQGRAVLGEVSSLAYPLDPTAGVSVSLIVAEES